MANCLMCNRPQRQGISLWDMVNFQPFSPIIVCDRCQSAFTAIEKNKACPGCSRLQKDDQFCEDCQKWRLSYPEEFIQHQSCYLYNEALKDWLHNYKIKGDSRLALVFKAKLTEIYQDYSDYVVVPLPISEKSYIARGFNQSELLLEAAKIPYQSLLTNHYEGDKQSQKNRQQRLQSEQPFSCTPSVEGIRKVLLFDDIYTTGRTLLHAKAILYQAGVEKIESLTIAR
jgi:competence protein ComFC